MVMIFVFVEAYLAACWWVKPGVGESIDSFDICVPYFLLLFEQWIL